MNQFLRSVSRTTLKTALLTVLFLFAFGAVAYAAASLFADAGLEKAVKQELRLKKTPTAKDLTKLQYLYAQPAKIKSLKGLDKATNLVSLGVEKNAITDLSPLKASIKLQELYAGSNQISSLQPLAGAKKLLRLDLSGNKISDLRPITGLTQLKDLRLDSNKIMDIKPLAGFTNLQALSLMNNQISDVSILGKLGVQKPSTVTQGAYLELYLSGNKITKLNGIEQISKLTLLNVSKNQLTDLTPLKTLAAKQTRYPSLGHLDISYNKINDLSVLPLLKNVYWVDATGNPIDYTSQATIRSIKMFEMNGGIFRSEKWYTESDDYQMQIAGSVKVEGNIPLQAYHSVIGNLRGTPADASQPVSYAYNVFPENYEDQMNFTAPAHLTVQLDPALLYNTADKAKLAVWGYDREAGTWEKIGGTFDEATNTIQCDINNLGTYVVFISK